MLILLLRSNDQLIYRFMLKLGYITLFVASLIIAGCIYLSYSTFFQDFNKSNHSGSINSSNYLKAKSRYQSFVRRNKIKIIKGDNVSEKEILKQIDLIFLLNRVSDHEYNDLSIISAYESSENYK